MNRIIAWPSELPPALDGLHAAVAERLGTTAVPVDPLLVASDANPGDTVLAVIDGTDAGHVLKGLRAISDAGLNLVVVIGDGYLGTDIPDIAAAQVAAAAVATVRSIAARPGDHGRANAVCVPDALFGETGLQKGPLAQPTELVDVVEATAFLIGAEGGYLTGQVLFVDGGRHLFSSMSA